MWIGAGIAAIVAVVFGTKKKNEASVYAEGDTDETNNNKKNNSSSNSSNTGVSKSPDGDLNSQSSVAPNKSDKKGIEMVEQDLDDMEELDI